VLMAKPLVVETRHHASAVGAAGTALRHRRTCLRKGIWPVLAVKMRIPLQAPTLMQYLKLALGSREGGLFGICPC
jgi:hypothetical protein